MKMSVRQKSKLQLIQAENSLQFCCERLQEMLNQLVRRPKSRKLKKQIIDHTQFVQPVVGRYHQAKSKMQ